jgi:hypothetical protein
LNVGKFYIGCFFYAFYKIDEVMCLKIRRLEAEINVIIFFAKGLRGKYLIVYLQP